MAIYSGIRIFPLKMVIFNSYAKLPEGTPQSQTFLTCDGPVFVDLPFSTRCQAHLSNIQRFSEAANDATLRIAKIPCTFVTFVPLCLKTSSFHFVFCFHQLCILGLCRLSSAWPALRPVGGWVSDPHWFPLGKGWQSHMTFIFPYIGNVIIPID